MKSDSVDQFFYSLPLIGLFIKRTHVYFKGHTAIANFVHMFFGLGIGLMFNETYWLWGFIALMIGIIGHLYAFIKE